MQQLKGRSRGRAGSSWELTGGGGHALGTVFAERKKLLPLAQGTLSENPQRGREEGKGGSFSAVTSGLIRRGRDGLGLVTCALGCWFTPQGRGPPLRFESPVFESISKEHGTRRNPLILNPWEIQSIWSWRGELRAGTQILGCQVGDFF